MSNIGHLVERMVAAGMSVGEASAIAAELYAAGVASASVRSSGAERTRRWREKKGVTNRHETSHGDAEPEASPAVTERHKASQCDADANPPIDTKIKNSKRRGSEAPSRGTRLDPGWLLTAEDRQAARQEGFSDAEIDREAMRFRDYWIAASGSNAVKRDWSATWRNWVRRAAETLGKSRAGAPTLDFVPDWDDQVARWLRGQRWSTKWYGAEPGQPGCRVPPEILKKHGVLSEDRKIFAA